MSAASLRVPAPLSQGVGDYTAAQVTNAVSILGSYADPAWITSLAWAKITGAPTLFADPTTTKGDLIGRATAGPATRLAVGATANMALIVDSAQTLGVKWATMTAAMVTNAVDATQTYADPVWMTSLAYSKLTGVPATFAPSAHVHAAADVTSGVIAVARLGTGTPSVANYLRGDGAWTAAPADAVTSVFTRTGAIVAASGDYAAFYATAVHTHAAADITSGVMAVARLRDGHAGCYELPARRRLMAGPRNGRGNQSSGSGGGIFWRRHCFSRRIIGGYEPRVLRTRHPCLYGDFLDDHGGCGDGWVPRLEDCGGDGDPHGCQYDHHGRFGDLDGYESQKHDFY